MEQKLKALFQLQTMLSKIDEIKTLRGELPLEVQDLEDEIAGLSTRIERIQSEVADLKSAIATKKVEIETAKASVAKYKEQQENAYPGKFKPWEFTQVPNHFWNLKTASEATTWLIEEKLKVE